MTRTMSTAEFADMNAELLPARTLLTTVAGYEMPEMDDYKAAGDETNNTAGDGGEALAFAEGGNGGDGGDGGTNLNVQALNGFTLIGDGGDTSSDQSADGGDGGDGGDADADASADGGDNS